MPNWAAYKEAEKRGILPPEKKALYQEAIKRGLAPNPFQGGQTRPFEKLSPKQTFQGELRPLFMQPPGGEGSFAKPSLLKDIIQEAAPIAGDIGMSLAAPGGILPKMAFSALGSAGGSAVGQYVGKGEVDPKEVGLEAGLGAVGEAVAKPISWVASKVTKPLAKLLSSFTTSGRLVTNAVKRNIVKKSTDRALKFVNDLAPDIIQRQDMDLSTLGRMVNSAIDENRAVFDLYENTLTKAATVKEGGLVPVDDTAQFMGDLLQKAEEQLLQEGSKASKNQVYTRALKLIGHTKNSAPTLMKLFYKDTATPKEVAEIMARVFKTGKKGFTQLTQESKTMREKLKSSLQNDIKRLSPEAGALKKQADENFKAIHNFNYIKGLFDKSVQFNKETGSPELLPDKFNDLVYSAKSKILKDPNLKDMWPALKKEADYFKGVIDSYRQTSPINFMSGVGPTLSYFMFGGIKGIPIIEGMGASSAYALMSPRSQKVLQQLLVKPAMHIGGKRVNFSDRGR